MRENADQNNSEYGHFSRSEDSFDKFYQNTVSEKHVKKLTYLVTYSFLFELSGIWYLSNSNNNCLLPKFHSKRQH